MSDLIRLLFSDYCYYRRQTANSKALRARGSYVRDPKFTPEREETLADLVTFCREKNLPPRQWLYYLFARRRWLYPPRFDRTNLLSERALAGYTSWPDFSGFQKRITETAAQRQMEGMVDRYDPNRDLSLSVELLKKSLVARGEIDRCLAGIHSQTYGYHPRSHICCHCSQRFACATELQRTVNFDILALRRGEITSAQARASALAGVNRYAR